jgi:FAD/FMN-containing dehydrogenase
MIMFEGYSLQGVKRVNSDSTAFPHRDDNMLISPFIFYKADPKLDAKARAFGKSLRQILVDASGEPKLHAYVNYANMDERPEDMYGYDAWRIERLRALKDKYDPQRKFSFYAPVE